MTPSEEILLKLRGTLPSKKRAELEQALFDLLPKDRVRQKHGMPEALRTVHGLPFYEVKHRLTLRLAGSAADPLWDAIDGGLALLTAVNLLREARRRCHAKGTHLDFEIEEVLCSYQDRTVFARNKKGGYYKRRADPKYTPDVQAALESIRLAARSYAERAAVTVERVVRQKMVDSLMSEIDGLLKAFALRVAHEETKAKTQTAPAAPPRSAFREACEVLGIPASLPINMTEAKKRYRYLAKQYHPDMTKGDTGELFDQVVKAFALIQRVHEGQETNHGAQG